MRPKQKLVGVQYLRAIAALMVAYYHLMGQIPSFTRDLSFARVLDSSRLSAGVFIFFVISGFIMYVTGRELSAAQFAWRRLARIVPLYWALTLSVCALGLLLPAALHRTDLSLPFVAKSLLFIPYHNPTQQALLFPILVPGWTLNYEMFFYAIFAGALLAPARYRMWIASGTICAFVAAGMAHPKPILLSIWGFYTGNTLILFAAGILLGATYVHLRLPRSICITLVVAGFWLLLTDYAPVAGRAAAFAGAIAIVTGAVAWEHQFGIARSKLLLLLGDASYSIYLVHLFSFGITRAIWKHMNVYALDTAASFAVASMLAAIGLALLTYYFIERPTLALITDRLRQRAITESHSTGNLAIALASSDTPDPS